MKCEIVIQNIDRYFNEELGELDAETRQHLVSCQDCNLNFTAQNKAGDIVSRIADFEPVLQDPAGLTEDIMMGLSDSAAPLGATHKTTLFSVFNNVNFRRALSAAAIILFAVFGVEQYLVLDKINRLETQAQKASTNKNSLKELRLYNAWEFQLLRNFNQAKSVNKELLKKINTLGNSVALSNIISGFPDKYAFDPDDVLRELYEQKEFSPLMRKYLTTMKTR
jgi:hypothetical protein